MKKSIFLFFAAILCAMSVSAKVIYFKPNGNWAQANANFYAYVWGGSGATSPVKFTPVATDPTVYQAEIGTHNQVIFLRMDPSKTVTSSNMWNNPPLWNRMGNISIPTDGKNCCTIKDGQWSQEKNTTNGAASYVTWSTYTPPTTVPDYYLTGTLAGGWNANDVKMTYDEATETYSHTFTAVAANAEQKFKVTDGTWSKSWGGAAVSPAIDGITTDGDGNAVFTLSAAGNVTVTFKDSKIQVTTTGAFKVPVTYPYYILGTMNSWSVEEEYGLADENEDGIYTREITLAAGEHFFKINIGKWDSQWGWSNVTGKYTEATDAKDDNKIKITLASEKTFTVEFNKSKNQISFDGLTKIEDYYTVVGVAELFGEAWATKNEANKMAKQSDGSYKLVKENVTLAAIGYDWKIAKNGDWWNDAATGVNPSSGNNTLTITTAGRYNVTFTLAADLKSAKAETELLEAAVVIPDCFISGNKNLTGKETEWQGNEFTMVYDEATETWSYTLAGLQPEKAYELKVVCGGTWYSYANLTSVPTGVTEGNDHSIAFKMAEAGDVTVTYNVEDGITLSGNFALPVTYDYYIAGTLAGGWSAKQQGMEKDGDVYKHTFTELNAGTYQFKITDGQFNTEEDKTHEHTTLGAEYEEVSYNDGNIKIVTEEAINLTVIFNAATDKITFEGLTEKAPAKPAKCYLMGIGGDWTTGIEMEEDGEQFKLLCQPIAEGEQFKFKHGDTWSDGVENYDFPGIKWVDDDKDGNSNITLPAGNYNFYYKKATNQVYIAAATDCETEPETYTRTVTPGNYGTICLPYASSSYTGAEFYEVSWLQKSGETPVNLYLDQLADGNQLVAGKPYIFRATSSELTVTYTGEAVAAPVVGENGLTGSFDAIPAGGVLTGNYVVAQNKFWTATADAYAAENRAYINATIVPTTEPAKVPGRRRVSLGAAGENAETGIDNIITTDTPVKVIENGQLIIIRNGEKFNAQGVRL